MLTNTITTMTDPADLDALLWFANDWAKLDDETRELVAEIMAHGSAVKKHPAATEPVGRGEVARAYNRLRRHAPRVMVRALRAWLDADDEEQGR